MVLPITKPQNHRQNLRLCTSSNPFFTQKTTTSSVGGCTFVRISGKFDYPIIYTDPDGRHDETTIAIDYRRYFSLDENGEISSTYSGTYETIDSHGNRSLGTFENSSFFLPEKSLEISILGLFGRIMVYDTELNDVIKGTIIPKHSVDILRQNLQKQGEKSPGRNFAAHHIIPGQDDRASAAKNILIKYGIDPNHAENGIWLSPKDHYKTFSLNYMNRINDLMEQADQTGTQSAVLETLKYIKEELRKNNFNF
jgi:hypothetical protein